MGASKKVQMEDMESWCGECGNDLVDGFCRSCNFEYSKEEYSKSYWWLVCNHIPSKQRPCKYRYSNGSVHFGFQCMTCGSFSAKSKKSFGLNPPTEWIDVSVKDRFRLFNDVYSLSIQEKMSADAQLFFERFPIENWRERYEAYIESDEWMEKSKRIKEQNPVCCECNERKSLHVHHKTYRRMGFELDCDLIAVCYECHAKKHDHMKILNLGWDSLT